MVLPRIGLLVIERIESRPFECLACPLVCHTSRIESREVRSITHTLTEGKIVLDSCEFSCRGWSGDGEADVL